jgi:hypothetical protein
MSMKFDTPFDRWMRANDIRPLRLARKAHLSRPTILRLRKGSPGTERTRIKVLAAFSTLKQRKVTEADVWGKGITDQRFQ